MVRKTQFQSEDVVQAAFNLVADSGLEHLSARHVADRLGSSTAPVYSNFENMDQLQEAAFEFAVKIFMDFTQKDHTPNPFLNIGIGVLEFSRQYPLWYQAFSKVKEPGQAHLQTAMDSMLEIMVSLPEMKQIPSWERKILLRKMSIFTNGLAVEVSIGEITQSEFDDFLLIMNEVGEALTLDAMNPKERSQEEIKRLSAFCHEKSEIEEGNPEENEQED